MCQYCTYRTNYPEKEEEDLDDNDAVASISDVQTAGILLAQQYIRTSLIALIACLLTNIQFATDGDVAPRGGHPYNAVHTSKNAHYVYEKIVIVFYFNSLNPFH